MNNQQKKKKSGISWAMLVFLLPFLVRMLDGDLHPAIFLLIALVIVGPVIVSKMAKAKVGASNSTQGTVANSGGASHARHTPEVELHRPVPSMQRREPAAQRNFSQPDPYCVSCELSGEDHFVRDRQRRIQQLDSWLKNGLVDKQEYLVLKRRFEHDQ